MEHSTSLPQQWNKFNHSFVFLFFSLVVLFSFLSLYPASMMFTDDWIDGSTHSLSNCLPGTVLMLCHLSSAVANRVTAGVSKAELEFAKMLLDSRRYRSGVG